MRLRATLIAVTFASIVAGAAYALPSGTDHKFHAHVDAQSAVSNCASFTWSSAFAMCRGHSVNGNNGTANGFHDAVWIWWCGADNDVCKKAVGQAHLTLPHGYDRWMAFCRPGTGGICHNYLLGAVKMPNGPFAVVAGRVDGHPVAAQSADPGRVEHPGGPLFLYVGYAGLVSHSLTQHGYVFGFRGWIHW